MRVPSIVGALGAIVLAAALGCGPKPETVQSNSTDHICSQLKPQGDPVDTVTVALFDDVDPRHAPAWRNDSERLVFYHLYETIGAGWDATCLSRRSLRLVEFPVSAGKDVTTYTLRSDARFWDGTPVTIQDIAECARAEINTSVGIDSVVVLDDRRLCVYATTPGKLSSSARGVVRRTPHSLWPMGSGPYRIDPHEDLNDGELVLTPVVEASGPVIRFIDARGVDPRDVVDGSPKPQIDFMVLRDREVGDYATSLGQFEELQIARTRAYLLLSVDRAEAIDRGSSLPSLTDAFKYALVQGSVRNAYCWYFSEPVWQRVGDRCRSVSLSAAASMTRSQRIVYDSRDSEARDLADRIVSLATSDTTLSKAMPGIADERSNLVSIGLSPQQLEKSLGEGADFAYVIGIRYEEPDFCPAVSDLLEAAPWLAGDRFTEKILPLAVTMSMPIARRTSQGFGFDVRSDDFGNLMIVRRNSNVQP